MTDFHNDTYTLSPIELHNRMIEWFGLPVPTEKDFPEVFGWYHTDGETRYWVHDPKTSDFTVVTADSQWITANLAGVFEPGDLTEISQLMDSLKFLPKPAIPQDPTRASKGETFAYEGWLFAWFFVPELRRWELGPVERRWRVEKSPARASEDLEIGGGRRERLLSMATKSIEAGVQLFDRYSKSMLLLGTWNAPEPCDGFHMIAGAATEAAAHFGEPTDVIRVVAKATGCEESQVQSVIDYLNATGMYEGKWFRRADCQLLFPELL